MIPDKLFGVSLKRERERREWSLREMEKQTGLSYSYLSQIETGIVTPSLKFLEQIANTFDFKEKKRESFLAHGLNIEGKIREMIAKFPSVVLPLLIEIVNENSDSL